MTDHTDDVLADTKVLHTVADESDTAVIAKPADATDTTDTTVIVTAADTANTAVMDTLAMPEASDHADDAEHKPATTQTIPLYTASPAGVADPVAGMAGMAETASVAGSVAGPAGATGAAGDAGSAAGKPNAVDDAAAANKATAANDAAGTVGSQSTASPVAMTGRQTEDTRADTPRATERATERTTERTAGRATGPSAATIIFGVCILLLGGVSVAFGWFFPVDWISWAWSADPRIAAAFAFASFGGLLVVIAMIWSIASLVRNRKHRDEQRD